jgi:hypothetical protein
MALYLDLGIHDVGSALLPVFINPPPVALRIHNFSTLSAMSNPFLNLYSSMLPKAKSTRARSCEPLRSSAKSSISRRRHSLATHHAIEAASTLSVGENCSRSRSLAQSLMDGFKRPATNLDFSTIAADKITDRDNSCSGKSIQCRDERTNAC